MLVTRPLTSWQLGGTGKGYGPRSRPPSHAFRFTVAHVGSRETCFSSRSSAEADPSVTGELVRAKVLSLPVPVMHNFVDNLSTPNIAM